MFGVGPWELMLVFAIVLLLFGGKRLPGIATGLGSAIRNFKNALKDCESEQPQKPKTPDQIA
ncbi:MAG: twin-arginine translocase TatA/TatE family subunit [Myxococcaceae bacterium]|nr:twin-arginine translocase TatA/TatE family subunit [Myxococcaceae bacterium]MBH2006151.1 twin-arginine translocase TatA/TatE family subunit [Myxococcaceae bacterium]